MWSNGRGWKRVLGFYVAPFLLFVLTVLAMGSAVGWLALHLPLGHGQYAVNLVNQRNEAVVARTNDGLGIEIGPCATRQTGMAYVRGQRWELTVFDDSGKVVYRDDRTLPAVDAGVLIFTVTIPPANDSQCPNS